MRQELGTTGHGREAAASHGTFVSAYSIVETRLGKKIVGSSPDGRLDFMCMRCLRDLKNVYVFTNAEQNSFMHVGMDCAEKMGISVEELRKAAGHFDRLENEDRRRASAEQRRAEAEAREAKTRANREACAALVSEIEALLTNPALTSFEANVLHNALSACEANPNWYEPEWLVDSHDEWQKMYHNKGEYLYSKLSARLDSVRERLALAATSKPVTGKHITGAFRGYRPHIELDGFHGGKTYVSFVTDDAGNAYVIKSAEFIVRQGCTVIGTFSLGESETRDGLTATRLLRPRKINPHCYQETISAWSFVSLKHAHIARSFYEAEQQAREG